MRQSKTQPELKPCPFCGGAAEIMPHALTGKFSVIRATCMTCHSHHHNGIVLHEDAKDHQIESARVIAAQRWNQRHGE